MSFMQRKKLANHDGILQIIFKLALHKKRAISSAKNKTRKVPYKCQKLYEISENVEYFELGIQGELKKYRDKG